MNSMERAEVKSDELTCTAVGLAEMGAHGVEQRGAGFGANKDDWDDRFLFTFFLAPS